MTLRIVKNDPGTCRASVNFPDTGADLGEMDAPRIQYSTPPSATRPNLVSHPSSSLPSTPYQRPRNRDSHSRSSSIDRSMLDASPKSSHSDSNPSVSTLRRRTAGCKYEAGMARARRRVPYSLGPDKLDPEPLPLKQGLTTVEDDKLSGDMRELYDRLLPSPESEDRRKKLVAKLEQLLNSRWPGHSIKVHVFGSSGNSLGTSDSDVDICITTDWKALEHVCILAEFLAGHGMQRVVCVSSAKVPIVKVWDPELQLACDLNVNNTVALENTELIRSYVALDERTRPLAMIIKHWARRRILNDAALGGTLSSYTWICMIINFLQTRDPPILPSLQQQPGVERYVINGLDVAFDKNLDKFRNYGKRNTTSLGRLLFQFFHHYGHEVDFEDSVMSVRMGKILPKVQKGWHLLQDNRLCVEEPFNTSRNLANTADDTSMRGIHLELRRAFGLVARCKLGACCEGYIPAKDESRTSEIFIPPVSRPVVTQAPPQTTKPIRSAVRGGRHSHSFRGNGSSRRQSNPSSNARGAYLRNLPFGIMQQDLQLQAQHQQHLLHDRLFQQYQYLQAQEQQLRMQLHEQALLQGRIPPAISYPHIAFPNHVQPEEPHADDSSSRASSVNRIPLSAPVHQQRFGYSSPFLPPVLPDSAQSSNPSSPHLETTLLPGRRLPRRSSLTQSSTTGSLRAHSQPARPVNIMANGMLYAQPLLIRQDAQQERRSSTASSAQESLGETASTRSLFPVAQPYVPRRPSEYVGWYIGQSPSLAPYPHSAGISPIPSHVGLAIQNGGLSPRSFSQEAQFNSLVSPSPIEQLPSTSNEMENRRGRKTESQKMQRLTIVSSNPPPSQGGGMPNESEPKRAMKTEVANSTDTAPEQGESLTLSATTSEDLAFDTPYSSDDQSQTDPDRTALGKPVVLSHQRSGHQHPDEKPQPQRPLVAPSYQHADPGLSHSHGSDQQQSDVWGQNSDPLPGVASSSGNPLPVVSRPGGLGLAGLRIAEQLPPVTEVRTPSPSHDSASLAGRSRNWKAEVGLTTNGVGEKAEPRGQSDPVMQPSLAQRSNGQQSTTSLASSTMAFSTPSGWQTQKKKKKGKKHNKSENDMDLSPSTADIMPLDEDLRKGG